MRALSASVLLIASTAWAMPPAPRVVCDVWPEAAPCAASVPDCTTCHTSPPARNVFGRSVEAVLAPAEPRPLTPEAFEAALPAALDLVAEDDADGDGVANRDEIIAGTSPADAADLPGAVRPCAGPNGNPDWNVCGYDAAYVWRKLHLDVCGESPSYEALLAFKALPEGSTRMAAVDAALDTCLDSDFWLGRDGALWQLAHRKIRPLQAIKQGRNRGPVPLADYDHDYALFAYTQSDDRDARLALTADFHVRFTEDPPHYEAVPTWPDERLETTRRAGMITTRWFFTINTMFTPVPRTTAAQAYRAYLGLDIARSEGLVPPAGALVDYDDKGVTHPTCAGCHETLDPLAYPFSRYEGILSVASGTYNGLRMLRFGTEEGRRVREVPEAGALFGEPVDDLIEWARKAADSDAFAQATVRDYWRLLIGHDPTPAERREFDALWRDFREVHGWRVEYMLHDLVRTEAYGAP